MGDDLKFQQRWEFREGRNGGDSSTDNSKSCSTGERVLVKHQLVAGLISVDNDETSCETSKIQKIPIEPPVSASQINSGPQFDPVAQTDSGVHIDLGDQVASGDQIDRGKAKEKKRERKKRKKVADREGKRDSNEEVIRRKTKAKKSAYDPAAFGNFTDSLIDDLKATRENLVTWMRGEMNKLVGNDTGPKRKRTGAQRGKKKQLRRDKTKGTENNSKKDRQPSAPQQNGDGETVPMQLLSNNGNIGVENNGGVGYDQESGLNLALREKDKGKGIAFDINSNSPLNPSNQDVQKEHPKSVVLAITAQNGKAEASDQSAKGKKRAASRKQFEAPENGFGRSQGIGSSASAEKDKAVRSRSPVEQSFSANPSDQIISTMYLPVPTILSRPSDSSEDRLDSLLCNISQTRIARTKTFDSDIYNGGYLPSLQSNLNCSGSATGYSLPLRRGTDGSFSIPGQFCLENLSRESLNTLAHGMSGGSILYSGGRYALPENFLSNNLQGLPSYRADSRLLPYQIPNLRDGSNFFPK